MHRRVCTETVHIRCDARAYRAQAKNGQDLPANSTNFAIYNACSGSIGFVFQTAAELSDRGDQIVVDWSKSLNGGEGGIATVVVEREVRVGERWYVSCFQWG